MKPLFCLAIALALGACATTTPSQTAAQKPAEEKEFRTGSRIPVRDPVAASPTTTMDPSVMAPGGVPRTN
jgi:hypothetical protein